MDKNKLMMVIIILILAVMFAAVGFGFAYTIRMIKTVQTPPSTAASANLSDMDYDLSEMRLFDLADSIKANLLPENDGVEHLALVSVSVGVVGPSEVTKKEKKTQDEEIEALLLSLRSNEPIVRDIVIRQLRKSTHSDLRRSDGQEILQNSLTTELQNTFNSNYIVKVYFGEFFLQ